MDTFDSRHDHYHGHEHTLTGELVHHLPYAIFSVAFALSVLSFLVYLSFLGGASNDIICRGSDALFHSFHFMHIVFAATGTLITFYRFSNNIFKGLLVGLFSATVFCTLSDVFLPYLGGTLMGVNMHLHICFFSELHNILPFLFVGLFNGFVMSRHPGSHQGLFSIFSHFVHILISTFASMFYLVSHGCTDWYLNIGFVFLFLVVAVVVPCTLSDVVVPMAFARADKKHAKH
ncbi:MAG TPA: hypothetical protein VLG71_00810 [Candidatus Limnocylindria bacterium]|nr:hypothetical protein [Candidatus Limnocylindria bacterium]